MDAPTKVGTTSYLTVVFTLIFKRGVVLWGCMHLRIQFLAFIYCPTLRVRAANSLMRLHSCAGSSEYSLLALNLHCR